MASWAFGPRKPCSNSCRTMPVVRTGVARSSARRRNATSGWEEGWPAAGSHKREPTVRCRPRQAVHGVTATLELELEPDARRAARPVEPPGAEEGVVKGVEGAFLLSLRVQAIPVAEAP